jgi:hypothetical protein
MSANEPEERKRTVTLPVISSWNKTGDPLLVIIPKSGDYLISFAVKADYTTEHRRIMVLLLEKIVLLKEN